MPLIWTHRRITGHSRREAACSIRSYLSGRQSANGAPQRLGTPNVGDARGLQVLEAFQAVGVDRRSPTDVLLDEIDHRGLFEVRDHRHPNATGDAAPVSTAVTTIAAFRPLS
jgi:hypothetical protein